MPNDLFDATTPTTEPAVNAPVSTPAATSTPASTVTNPPTNTNAGATSTPPTGTSPTASATEPAKTGGEMTEEQISKVAEQFFSKVTKAAGSAQPAQQQKKEEFTITPELAESLKPVRVTQQMLAGLGFDGATPEQIQAFQAFADAIVTHAAHVSNFLQQRTFQQAASQYDPIVNYVKQMQYEAHRNSFYGENKDLQKYEKFVRFAASQVSPTKADGSEKSAKEVATEVAAATRALLKEAGINLDSQNSANQVTPGTNTAPKMPTLDTGGGSMSGSTQGKNTKPSIFDDL